MAKRFIQANQRMSRWGIYFSSQTHGVFPFPCEPGPSITKAGSPVQVSRVDALTVEAVLICSMPPAVSSETR